MPHVVAGALVGEPMDVHTFSSAKLHDPAIAAQRGKVRMIVHDDWGYDQLGKKEILTIRLVDGSEHRAVCTTARGTRSEERRVGKELVSTCSVGGTPDH